MKGHREHRVPLSDRAVEILENLPREGEFVFVGSRAGTPLSNMALLMTLRRMGRGDLTAHGFRSTFKDWATETTAYPVELSEMALAHIVSDKTEAAYRRGDMLEKRRRLMADWAAYCASPERASDNVRALRGAIHG
jgi:integrase